MSRFIKIAADGSHLPPEAKDHVAVLDTQLNLMWSADDISGKELAWKAAGKAAAKLKLAGFSDWRLPTVEELFLLADRSRYAPAISTDFFPTAKSSWYWSSSPVASAPSDYAWIVHFDYGFAGINGQHYTAFVRAVRSVAPPSGQ